MIRPAAFRLCSTLARCGCAPRRHLKLLLVVSVVSGVFFLLYAGLRGGQAETLAVWDGTSNVVDDNDDGQLPPSTRNDDDGEAARAAGRQRRRRFARCDGAPTPVWTKTLYYDPAVPPEAFGLWKTTKSTDCSRHFVGYGHQFAHLTDVVVDRTLFASARRGGEPIGKVLNQDESAEYYVAQPGCFRLPHRRCRRLPPYWFEGDQTHLGDWVSGLTTDGDPGGGGREVVVDQTVDQFTIAVTRYEYVNLFHTMTDWYNAFLMMEFFGRTPAETNILIVDAHPFGGLDPVWPQLFNSTIRLSALPVRTLFRRLVWSIVGYQSPMKIFVTDAAPPLYDEFRVFFLSAFGIDDGPWSERPRKTRDCDHLSVLFIWRRDYLAHPRNPEGRVARKIRNEAELVRQLRRKHPEYRVEGVQIDALPMADQLRLVVDADILVGVHGAGLTHALFLRAGSGVIEFAPDEMWSGNEHFEAISAWRRLVYRRWINNDPLLVSPIDASLTVPPLIANGLIAKVARKICPPKAEPWN